MEAPKETPRMNLEEVVARKRAPAKKPSRNFGGVPQNRQQQQQPKQRQSEDLRINYEVLMREEAKLKKFKKGSVQWKIEIGKIRAEMGKIAAEMAKPAREKREDLRRTVERSALTKRVEVEKRKKKEDDKIERERKKEDEAKAERMKRNLEKALEID